jgi:TusA-related sulfurtransferase
MKAAKIVDARGLHCPMPVIKTKKALEEINLYEILEVRTTDPASKADIPVLLKRLGHCLIEIREETGVFIFIIKKSV